MFATLSKQQQRKRVGVFVRKRLIDTGICRTFEEVTELIGPMLACGEARQCLREAGATLSGAAEGRPGDSSGHGERGDADVVDLLSTEERQQYGVFMTPRPVALGLAAGVEVRPGDTVADFAAGTGRLLEAAVRAEPGCRVVGVEQSPMLAVLAGVNIAAARAEYEVYDESERDAGRRLAARIADDRVFVGDGLDERESGPYDVVVLNPPYGGEKGRGEAFREIRRAYPDLDARCGGRYDVAYFFVHRALDRLKEGGRLGLVSTEYWLYATGAAPLRGHLSEAMVPVWMVRTGKDRLFEDAPGQHSLISRFDKTESADQKTVLLDVEGVDGWMERLDDLLSGSLNGEEASATAPWRYEATVGRGERAWRPFLTPGDREMIARLEDRGRPLAEFAVDRQGVVSGADRVSQRRLTDVEQQSGRRPTELEAGDPGFMWEETELPERLASMVGTVVRPVLRGSYLEAGRLIVDPPTEQRMLYIDDEVPPDMVGRLVSHLAPLEPSLASRREVRRGRMPWYRLHWPRRRAEQVGPKLVVPRRAAGPRFALDLSGAAVSSDCTYLCAPEWVEEPIRHLVWLMHALNSSTVARYLALAGKSKGEVVEFYAEPLRRIPLPFERRTPGEGETVDWTRAEAPVDSDQSSDGTRLTADLGWRSGLPGFDRDSLEAKVEASLRSLGF